MTEAQQFVEKEVEWLVDDIPVFGTLTRPKTEKPHSAVVFVAGSGPTDRDWCSPLLPGKNGSAKLLAAELAAKGMITLRYDKRASGPHVRENIPKMIGKISMQSHVDELSGAVKTLLAEGLTDPRNLFVLTNSEGTIHALNYQLQAKDNQFKGLVLTGAPGRSIGDVARMQVDAQVKSLPYAETIMKHYDEAIASFIEGKPVIPDASLPEGIKMLLSSLTVPANLPFARELWAYNSSEYIWNVKEPMLIIIGKKDVQVDWVLDGQALERATANGGNASFVYPENANHVLKHEETPRDKLTAEASLHYNEEGRILDRDAVNAINDWLSDK